MSLRANPPWSLPGRAGLLLSLAWLVFWLVGPSLLANRWYYNHCVSKIREVRARGGSKDQTLARLEAAGGTGNMAVVIVAVVAVVYLLRERMRRAELRRATQGLAPRLGAWSTG